MRRVGRGRVVGGRDKPPSNAPDAPNPATAPPQAENAEGDEDLQLGADAPPAPPDEGDIPDTTSATGDMMEELEAEGVADAIAGLQEVQMPVDDADSQDEDAPDGFLLPPGEAYIEDWAHATQQHNPHPDSSDDEGGMDGTGHHRGELEGGNWLATDAVIALYGGNLAGVAELKRYDSSLVFNPTYPFSGKSLDPTMYVNGTIKDRPPAPFVPNSVGTYGGGGEPIEATYGHMVKEAYKDNPQLVIRTNDQYGSRNGIDYVLVINTPTIKIYVGVFGGVQYVPTDVGNSFNDFGGRADKKVMGKTIRPISVVMAVRGTDGWDDIKADLENVYNNTLYATTRMKTDMAIITDNRASHLLKSFPLSFRYGCGHSLGGALVDRYIKEGYISKGMSFNPALEPENVRLVSKNYRIYNRKDPLYMLFGWTLTVLSPTPPVVRYFSSIISSIPIIGDIYDFSYGSYNEHVDVYKLMTGKALGGAGKLRMGGKKKSLRNRQPPATPSLASC